MKIVKLSGVLDGFNAEDYNNSFVIPTETVYGLAARIDDEKALKQIFEIKGRPADNPLIVHVSSMEMLKTIIVGDIPGEYHSLMKAFWPGPLTLIFKCPGDLSKVVRGNSSDTVAVRMPRNPLLLGLIERLGVPLAAPSANTSGRPSPTRIEHAIDDLGDKVSLYIDDGPCEVGLESTVFGILDSVPILLRPGGITREEIEDVLQCPILVKNTVSPGEQVICPGQKYKHYAPSIPVYLFKGENWRLNMVDMSRQFADEKLGVVGFSDVEYGFPIYKFFDLGLDIKDWCRNIFSSLRELDKSCDVIFIKAFSLDHEGLAIMDRINKAATHVIE